jgi:3D (Asp-Asp-Asp) domain-containing protein
VSCYVESNEADFVSSPLKTGVPGLPRTNSYHSAFIEDTKMQGSGYSLDGTHISYNSKSHRFSQVTCPRLATGGCATDGVDAAVDQSIVPFASTIKLGGDGTRKASDTGGRFRGHVYRVDEYFGHRRRDCLKFGRQTRAVDLLSY